MIAVVLAAAAVLFTGVRAHEQWSDEAQSWLLARDNSVGDLLATRLRYEGHPPLWHLLLHAVSALGLPYVAANVLSALAALAAAVLILRSRTTPLVVRILLPFTYYLAYQYAVIARSYALIAPLLLLILLIYAKRSERIVTFALLLMLLAGVSLHAASLALGFIALYLWDVWRGRVIRPAMRSAIVAVALVAATAAFLFWMLRPPADLYYARHLDFEFRIGDMFRLAWKTTANNVFGPGFASFALLAAIAVWLLFAGALLEMAVLWLSLLPIFSIYRNPWHEGLFFLVLLFSILLGFSRQADAPRVRLAATAIVCILLVPHLYWAWSALQWDLHGVYSGGRDAAAYIREHGIDRQTLFGSGFGIIAIQPYFDHNIFANASSAWWDWSMSNPMLGRKSVVERKQDAEHWVAAMAARRPAWFLVALKQPPDDRRAQLIAASGYHLVATFPGAVHWKDHEYERETYALYAP